MRHRFVLALLTATLITTTAHAAATYELQFWTAATDVAPGGQVTVGVYLVESGSPSTVTADGGLAVAEFTITRNSGTSGIASADANPEFDFVDNELTVGASNIYAFLADETEPGPMTEITPLGNGIWLLDFTVDVSLTPDDASTFSLAALEFTTWNGTNLAPSSGDPLTLTVIPEPASLALVAAGIAVMFSGRRRRAA